MHARCLPQESSHHPHKKINTQDAIREGVPEIPAYKNLEDRVPKDAFTDVKQQLAVQLCVNPRGTDMVVFSLPQTWQRGEDGTTYSVRARAFKLPIADAGGNDRGESDLQEKAWTQCELVLNNQRVAEANCGRVQPIVLDALVRHGMNTLIVNSAGERMVIAVQLVSTRSIDQVCVSCVRIQ